MKTNKPIFLLFTALCFVFIACDNDLIDVQEQESSKAELVETKQKLSVSSKMLQENKKMNRMEAYNYFKNKFDAGEDIKAEGLDYLSKLETPELLKNTDYELMRDKMLATINPDDFNCDSSNIPISIYINSTISNWTFFDFLVYQILSYHPTYDAIIFKNPDFKKHEYGVNGGYTNALNSTFKDLQRFWDIYSDDIGMVPMKGTTYKDLDKLIALEALLFPDQTDEDNLFWAQLAQDTFGSDTFWNFNHPLLSFNAFALTTTDPVIKDRIVMGDGIMTGYEAIGLGDVAPQGILAHEFAHHIQFENGYFVDVKDPADQPDATRRTELMADAYAAYYLTHKRGATMNWKRVQQFLAAFYNIGDCSFDDGGHHGTHAQRLAAAQWGYKLADNASPNGHIMSAEEFFQAFEAALHDIIYCTSCTAN